MFIYCQKIIYAQLIWYTFRLWLSKYQLYCICISNILTLYLYFYSSISQHGGRVWMIEALPAWQMLTQQFSSFLMQCQTRTWGMKIPWKGCISKGWIQGFDLVHWALVGSPSSLANAQLLGYWECICLTSKCKLWFNEIAAFLPLTSCSRNLKFGHVSLSLSKRVNDY